VLELACDKQPTPHIDVMTDKAAQSSTNDSPLAMSRWRHLVPKRPQHVFQIRFSHDIHDAVSSASWPKVNERVGTYRYCIK
jgi:hypothetical protein